MKNFNKFIKKSKKYLIDLSKDKFAITILLIFILSIFLRFYQIETKNPFGYDQVDNAWAAKNIIINHRYPIVGMVAKGNSGIYIGPVYYYLIALLYWITNLNPIASGIFAGLTSIFSFWVLYYITKQLFSKQVALIAVLINTVSVPIIISDRVQWPVNFIPGVSLLIFYLLFRVISGDAKKIILLALVVGFAFNIHFTAIFFPIIIVLSLPLFPRKIESLKYILISIPLFIVWIIPNMIYMIGNSSGNSNATSYMGNYYHGFHLTRVRQIIGDAFIQFDPYLIFDKIKVLKFILFPLFFVVYFRQTIAKDKTKLLYLILLWFLIPWFVFASYSGEISDYYFSINRFVVVMILSFLICTLWNLKGIWFKAVVGIGLFAYSVYNIFGFFHYEDVGLKNRESKVLIEVNANRKIGFWQGVPESYLYYYFMRQKGQEVY